MTPQKFFACLVWAVLLSGIFASSQTVSSQSVDLQSATNQRSETMPTFHSTSRLVIVNVVATDRDGKPITGLDRSDFALTEDGKPQQLQVFERHVPVQQPPVLPAIKFPHDEYSNFPTQAANSAVNVVLFDVLNTPTTDQMFARRQMIEFLKTLPGDQRVALFTLGTELRMIAGFTTSTDELMAAAKKLRPNVSPLLDTEADMEVEDDVLGKLYSGGSPGGGAGNVNRIGSVTNPSGDPGVITPGSSGAESMALAMQDFLSEQRVVRTDVRAQKTFESLGALARALSGYTGRKNVFWLSEAFPASILPDREGWRDDILNCLAIFQRYSGLLEASQISVYPIDIRGLTNSGLTPITGSGGNHSPYRQDNDMVGSQLLMRNIAQQTGGRAFYNTNDLKGALQHAMEHGASYYTLGYVPQNAKWNGAFRHIAVKLDRPSANIDYREGYYAVRDDPSPADAAHRALVAEMQPGVPQSTMLLLRVKVTPPDDKSDKVSIDYGVYAPDITFTGDQQKHAKLEFVAVAWDKDNRAAGDVSETMDLNVKPETLQRMLSTGVPAHQDLALKPGIYKLRLGVMDYGNSKIGTLEVPVTVPAKEHMASRN